MSLYMVEIAGELPKQGYLSKAKKVDISVSDAMNILEERYEFGKTHYAKDCPGYVAALKVAIDAILYRFNLEGTAKIPEKATCLNCKHLYAQMVNDGWESPTKEYFCDEGNAAPWDKCEHYQKRDSNDRVYKIGR